MSKNAWECTLEIIKIATDIDKANEELSKTNDITDRKILSDRLDFLEIDLFELKNKLKKIDVI